MKTREKWNVRCTNQVWDNEGGQVCVCNDAKDARLIAALPDLVEALRWVHDHCKDAAAWQIAAATLRKAGL